ncbi:TKL family protein kinase [Histomonas meleagridis]|uniref:TKL family protein kinase n=1 Tax=Histomonas meleagridis TaxID=135588 RepID=UPI00355986B6|nr:TKL family protein kinase [Histomonas meleagridis]KAH0798157.1 TKL family protein kinase [Histomonas meleagridis]
MTELTPQTIVSNLIAKGNELIALAKQAYIFRASVAYLAQQIHSFLLALKPLAPNMRSDNQIQALRQIQDLFDYYGSVLPHLSESKWIQPALNWPAVYVHNYIAGLRKSLISLAPILGLDPATVIKFDEQQDQVNRLADLKSLKESVQNLMAQMNIPDAVGVQQQIETKLAEIKKLLPQETNNKRGDNKKRPSSESAPVVQIQRRVEELLSQFKAINIEVNDLVLHGQIGAGGFGTVYKATRLSTAEVVAVKELRSDRITVGSWTSLYAEVETMASVRHQFVLELVGAHITEPYRIITRFCSGKSLFDRLHRCSDPSARLSPTRLTIIAYEVAVGMEHLHSMNIVHRDLKTLNILLDEEDDGCVADFGLSGMMKDNQELCGGVGTPHYTAPEVLSHTRYGPKVDSFSYGVVLWEMLMRKVPFGDMSHMAIYEHVVTRGWRLPVPNETPEGLKKMITRCWSKNPNDRPDFSEIVQHFESGDVFFPGSEKINFQEIKMTKRCPPLDLDYALPVLKNPSDPHFSSVSYFIVSKVDEKLRNRLRSEHIIEELKNAKVNIEIVLLLASILLDESEFSDFFENGGLHMFKECMKKQRAQMISAAVRFGLKVPQQLLVQLQPFIPDLIQFLTSNSCLTNHHILQFLTRFDSSLLKDFVYEISTALVEVGDKVDDQSTFDAIVALLPLCQKTLKIEQLRTFYQLLSCNFIVPSVFIQTLIAVNDTEKRPELIFAILKATANSNVTSDFVDLLQECPDDVLERVSKMPNLFDTIHDLLNKGDVVAPLFLLFCIAPIHDASIALADSQLMQSLIQMKTHKTQRLQIFTVLCKFEDFCTKLKDIDGILHLLVSSLSEKQHVNSAVRLIGALSSHPTGCQILNDNGVLELFTQLFLSSSCDDIVTTQTILRNVAKNGCDIPQVSLIVSCLMQDMMYDHSKKCEIMDTLVALVETVPGSDVSIVPVPEGVKIDSDQEITESYAELIAQKKWELILEKISKENYRTMKEQNLYSLKAAVLCKLGKYMDALVECRTAMYLPKMFEKTKSLQNAIWMLIESEDKPLDVDGMVMNDFDVDMPMGDKPNGLVIPLPPFDFGNNFTTKNHLKRFNFPLFDLPPKRKKLR